MTRPRPTAGFTLVEVLVVIAILGILTGLLLPALHQARSAAQQLRCAAILREWGQAFHIYADQYKGLIPHTGDRTDNPYGFQDAPYYPQNESGYTYALPPLMGRPSWASFAPGSRPIGDLWQCPVAVVGPDSSYGYAPSSLGYHSYAANVYLDQDTPVGMPRGFVPYASFLNLARARSASVTLLMFEVTLNPQAVGGRAPGSYSCLAGERAHDDALDFCDRHPHTLGKLGGNLMMLDGHVEWADHLLDPTLTFPFIPPQTDRRWWPY